MPASGGDCAEDFFILGKTPRGLFREDQLAVDLDIEYATGALNQFGVDSELVLQSGRQTGGLGEIVSFPTVFDRHLFRHVRLPLVVRSRS